MNRAASASASASDGDDNDDDDDDDRVLGWNRVESENVGLKTT